MDGLRDTINRREATTSAPTAAGFSLVEVLVTLSISAVAASLIMLTARPSDPMRKESESLARTLSLLEGRARISGSPTGLVIEPNRYTIVIWTGEKWSALSRPPQSLSDGIMFELPAGGASSSKQELTPQLVFDPLGHSSDISLTLRSKDRVMSVSNPASVAEASR